MKNVRKLLVVLTVLSSTTLYAGIPEISINGGISGEVSINGGASKFGINGDLPNNDGINDIGPEGTKNGNGPSNKELENIVSSAFEAIESEELSMAEKCNAQAFLTGVYSALYFGESSSEKLREESAMGLLGVGVLGDELVCHGKLTKNLSDASNFEGVINQSYETAVSRSHNKLFRCESLAFINGALTVSLLSEYNFSKEEESRYTVLSSTASLTIGLEGIECKDSFVNE